MNTPSPLIPQGSLQDQQARAKSNVRIFVFGVIALHAMVFAGLLMQGCNRGKNTAGNTLTNEMASAQNELPRLDSGLNSSFQDSALSTNAGMTGAAGGAGTIGSDLGAQPPAQSAAQTPSGTGSQTTLPDAAPAGEAKEYAITKNDNFSKIASTHGVTLAALTKANPGVDSRRLRVGQKIQIPPPAPAAPAASASTTGLGFADPTNKPAGDASTHVVAAGENLTKIAKAHRTTIKAIKAANNLKTDRVNVGQKLKIPAASAGGSAPGAQASAAN